ncbi:hypothetical protein WT09_30705 [Burkholderia stagnalis]|uniref:class I SAM-dependent methyltransferase n=1 Tax=Burkholderia stagnalis TaxID=1503054 RepID=UPI00075E91C7|nr:class I SAM-dependent methyltransferase [Burkholderia stagnalis]KVN08197.1 hypothetical protein WT09_30705 [Burkholderia stagnalis]
MISYRNFEHIPVRTPVDRIQFISDLAKNSTVLDIGCYDETALSKVGTKHYLHHQITEKAKRVVGVDNSSLIPDEGIADTENSRIYRSDACDLPAALTDGVSYDVIVAGEFIEHIENHVAFLKAVRERFPGSKLVISTPNGAAMSNFIMSLLRKEAQHPDHLHVFSYKTLNTVFTRSGYKNFEIIPYHFYATELILNSRGIMKYLVSGAEKIIKIAERFFPMSCMGYIVVAEIS